MYVHNLGIIHWIYFLIRWYIYFFMSPSRFTTPLLIFSLSSHTVCLPPGRESHFNPAAPAFLQLRRPPLPSPPPPPQRDSNLFGRLPPPSALSARVPPPFGSSDAHTALPHRCLSRLPCRLASRPGASLYNQVACKFGWLMDYLKSVTWEVNMLFISQKLNAHNIFSLRCAAASC